jgi:hypothetical protein
MARRSRRLVVLATLAVPCLFLQPAEPVGAQGAQAEKDRKARAARKAKVRSSRPAAVPASSSGYPSCDGLLYVDTLCQLPDGRTCYVDEYALVNCH